MTSVDADFRSGRRLESECRSESIIYVTCAHVNEFNKVGENLRVVSRNTLRVLYTNFNANNN